MSDQNEQWVATDAITGREVPELFAPLRPFTEISRYRAWRYVGGGAFGKVFAGFHDSLGRIEAVKRMEIADPRLRQMSLAEARLMAALPPHPHLVTIHDTEEIGPAIFLTMQFIRGRALSKVEMPAPVERALAWIRDVCEALALVHANDVIHRDIKPANVFLTESGAAVLGDFGVARAVDSADPKAAIAGTPAYMAPESFLARARPETDIFAIGVMLYELLTGVRPFAALEALPMAEMPRAMAQARVEVPSVVRPGIPGRVDDLVMQMLAIRPEDRLRSPLDVLDRLPRYQTVVSAVLGDLTTTPADAVVCSANELLAMNVPGSSANAVLAGGGETILAEAQARRPVTVGDVVVTAGGRLPAARVLHAVIAHVDGRGVLAPLVERDLRRALWNALRRAHELHLHSIALPAMGLVLGRLGPEESARIMVDVVHTYLLEFRPPLERVTFVLQDKLVAIAFREAALARGMILL